MAITVVQHVTNTGSGTSLAVTVTSTGSGNLLIACPVVVNANVSSISDGTNTFTQFPSLRLNGSGTFSGLQIDGYYLASSTSGKTTITANFDASSAFAEMEVWEISGFVSGVQTDGSTNNTSAGSTGAGDGTNTGPGLTTAGSSGFVVAFCGNSSGPIQHTNNPKSGNAFTAGGDEPGSDAYCSLISSAAGTYTPVWLDDTASDAFISVVFAFKDAAAGATPGDQIARRRRFVKKRRPMRSERRIS